MNSIGQENTFLEMIDNFAECFTSDFKAAAGNTEDSTVESLAVVCILAGATNQQLSLARKAAAIQACNQMKGATNE